MLFDLFVRHDHAVGTGLTRVIERIVDDVRAAVEIVEGDAQSRIKSVAQEGTRRQ